MAIYFWEPQDSGIKYVSRWHRTMRLTRKNRVFIGLVTKRFIFDELNLEQLKVATLDVIGDMRTVSRFSTSEIRKTLKEKIAEFQKNYQPFLKIQAEMERIVNVMHSKDATVSWINL